MLRFLRVAVLLLSLSGTAAASEFKAVAFRVQTGGPWCYVIIKDGVGLRCNSSLSTLNAVLNGIRDDVGGNLSGETVNAIAMTFGTMRAEIVRVATGGPFTCLVFKDEAPTKVTSGIATLTAALNQARDDIAAGLGASLPQRGDVVVVSVAP